MPQSNDQCTLLSSFRRYSSLYLSGLTMDAASRRRLPAAVPHGHYKTVTSLPVCAFEGLRRRGSAIGR